MSRKISSSGPSAGEKKSLNVLHLLPEANVGGVENHVAALAAGLQRLGHTAIVVSNGGVLVKRLEDDGVEHICLPVHEKSPLKIRSLSRIVGRLLEERDIDIVHAHSRVPAWVSWFAARRQKRLFIVTAHGQYAPHLGSRVMIWGERIICVSEKVRDHLIEKMYADPSRMHVIYNGITLPEPLSKNEAQATARALREEFGLDDRQPLIGFVGRLAATKGLSILLEAVSRVLKRHPNLKTLIVGEGPKRDEVEQKIRELGIEKSVILTGRRDDVGSFLTLVDVFVNSSLSEGFGLACLEAMAYQAPIVATNVGGIPEMLRDNVSALLSPPSSPEKLAAAIVTLLEDKALQKRLTETARHDLETRFTLDRMVLEVESLYFEALRARSGRSEKRAPHAGAPPAVALVSPFPGSDPRTREAADLAVGLAIKGEPAILLSPYGPFAGRLREAGVEYVRLPEPEWPATRATAMALQARKALMRRRIKLLHFYGALSGPARLALNAQGKPPAVYSAFDAGPECDAALAAECDRVIVYGSAARERLAAMRCDKGKIETFPPCVGNAEWSAAHLRLFRRRRLAEFDLPEDAEAIGLFVGGDESGAELAVSVLEKVLAAKPDRKAMLFGPGAQSCATRLPEGKALVSVEPEDEPSLLALFDAVGVCSGGPASRRAALAAFAAGRAVALTDACDVAEEIEHGVTGFAARNGDPDALAEAILQLMGDPEGRGRMGEAAREKARTDFGLEKAVERALAVYNQIAG